MSNDKLARALSGSRLVEYDEQTELVYAWNGSLTVNVYSFHGDHVDTFTFSGDSSGTVSLEYAERAIQERMEEDREAVNETLEEWASD